MEQDEKKYPLSRGKILTGLFLVLIGGMLFLHKITTALPEWIFTWPVLIVGVGLLIGIQTKFKNFFWVVPVFWGIFGLIDQQRPDLHLHNYIAPIVFIFLGMFFIFRRRRKGWRESWRNIGPAYTVNDATGGDWLDTTSVFSGAKKVILSKNFKGGDITCFMGGAEIDLTKADIQGKVVMDMTAICGGIKLIVPANWDVKIQTTAVFAGVDDRRTVQPIKIDADKLLVLDGAVVCGGIEINSY